MDELALHRMRQISRIYEEGYLAGLYGDTSMDNCKYTKPDYHAAWIRGYKVGRFHYNLAIGEEESE
jgi:ribosome modulation factor